MTNKEELTIEQLEYYRNTYERYDGIESNIFEQICNELIDFKKSKTSTFSECIEEWEKLNFEWEVHLGWVSFINKKDDLIINIFVKNMRCYEIVNCTDEPIVFSFAFHNLINKTIKALEKKEDD